MLDMLDRRYLRNASEAFVRGDDRAVLVLLGHVSQHSRDVVRLIVQSAHRLGTSSAPEIADDSARSLALSAFSRVIDDENSSRFLESMDYVLLSHLHLLGGDLSGALRALSLAASRGCVEDLNVVVQRSLILGEMDEAAEARFFHDFAMGALINAITDGAKTDANNAHDSSRGVDWSALMVFFANQLLFSAQSKHGFEKNELSIVRLFCHEAYYIIHGRTESNFKALIAWVGSYDLLYAVGLKLRKTPFLLLAQYFFWRCFTQRPLGEEPVAQIVSLLEELKLHNKLLKILEKAFTINPRNLLVRRELMRVGDAKWMMRLSKQESQIVKIQSVFRGHLRRLWWKDEEAHRKRLRDEHFHRNQVAETRYANYIQKLRKNVLMHWIRWKKIRIETKVESILRIQSFFRTKICQEMLRQKRLHVERVNAQFLYVRFLARERRRRSMLHIWYDSFSIVRKSNAVRTLRAALSANNRKQQLRRTTARIIAALRVRCTATATRLFRRWREKFRLAVRRHAFVTIRFFLRRHLIKSEEQGAQLSKIDRERMLKLQNDYVRESYMVQSACENRLTAKMWQEWRRQFIDIKHEKMRRRMVLSLQLRFHANVAKKTMKAIRSRRERQAVFLLLHRRKRIVRIFSSWKTILAAQMIRRFLRYRRLRSICDEIERKNDLVKSFLMEKVNRSKKEIMARLIYFYKVNKGSRDRHSRWLHSLFDWWKHIIQLRKLLRRKYYLARFLETLNGIFLRSSFTKLLVAQKREKARNFLKSLVRISHENVMRNSWQTLLHETVRTKIARILLRRPMRKAFVDLPLPSLMDERRVHLISSWFRWITRWKEILRRRKVLANGLASHFVSSSIADFVSRNHYVFRLQQWLRVCSRRKRKASLKNFLVVVDEILKRTRMNRLFIFWSKWKVRSSTQNDDNDEDQTILPRSCPNDLSRRSIQEVRLHYLFIACSRIPVYGLLKKSLRSWLLSFLRSSQKKKSLNTIKIQHIEEYESSPDFSSYSFHRTWKSLLKTKTLVLEEDVVLTPPELAFCVHHAESVFIAHLDEDLVSLLSIYFRGNKLVFYNMKCGVLLPKLISNVMSGDYVQASVRIPPPPHFEGRIEFKNSGLLQVTLVDLIIPLSIALKVWLVMLKRDKHDRYKNIALDVGSSCVGPIGTLAIFFFARTSTNLERLCVWNQDTPLDDLVLAQALSELSHCSSLEDFRFSGPLGSETIRCLSECMATGFENLRRLEIMVHVDTDRSAIDELINAEKTRKNTGKCYRKILIIN